jgi:cell shape-determining protein MreC
MRRWFPWLAAAALAAVLAAVGADRWLAAGLGPATGPASAAWAPAGADPERTALREQVARLTAENAVLRQQVEDARSLAGRPGVAETGQGLIRARVVARPIRTGRRYLEIDAGAADGVREGMAVCLGWSLVGRVAGLLDGRSLVQSVTDAEFRLPVRLEVGEGGFIDGVWAGTGARDRAEIRWIEGEDLTILTGAPVVAAGGDGIPAGIVLGTVVAAERPDRARGHGHWTVTAAPLRDGAGADTVLLMAPPESR